MFKKQHLALAIAATLAATNAQAFDAESFTVSGYVKNETAALTKDGAFNGQASSTNDTTKYNDSGDLIKSESTVKLFVNGDVGESSTMHAELQLHNDSKAMGSHFSGNDTYTQSELLRELYVDTTAGDWDLRLGKQQIVWGTADGAKFLDMINPTDYREMAQNVMAESRIPTWAAKATRYNDDGSNLTVVVSQPRENVFAGLNRHVPTGMITNDTSIAAGAYFAAYNQGGFAGQDTISPGVDKGNPFVLKGVDSITGQYNGFLNIVPDLGTVAALFGRAFQASGTDNEAGLSANLWSGATFGFTVGAFNSGTSLAGFSSSFDSATSGTTFGDINLGLTTFWLDNNGDGDASDYGDVGQATSGSDATVIGTDDGGAGYTGQQTLGAFAAKFGTNLNNKTTTVVDSVFEYMDRTSFATFDAFVGATSQYVYDMPDDLDSNLSFKYSNTASNGLNYSLAYSYQYDPNPVIDLSWRNASGAKVEPTVGTTNPTTNAGTQYSAIVSLSGLGGYAAANADSNLNDATETAELEAYRATLRFTQTMKRAQNLGAAADFAIDTESMGPVVIRAEGLYQKDVYSPVIDRGALSIGNITKALTMRKGDKFKYVIGADVTALTDMMVSAQFIQERNLDFIDSNVDFDGAACSSTRSSNADSCGVYTADFAAMHMSNGFKKALKNKEFYSLFLSKPFGDSGEGRWNNILMLEEGGGRWNRFDVEYSLTNNLIGTAEYNKYWGDENSQFGQLEAASNVQVGLKYLFE